MLDFVRRFFVSCTQIFEAYADEIRVRLAENQPQNKVQERLQEYIYFFLLSIHPVIFLYYKDSKSNPR